MSEQTEQTSKTKKILLIGNGFDLRTGVKTTFRDFFRFVIYGVIWHNYSKSEVLKTMITKSEFSDFKPDSEISPEELFEKFFEEKIKNKVPQIAKTYRKKEDDSEHPLEILLRLPCKERKILAENCRKFIETELGEKLFKNVLNNEVLNNTLRINMTSKDFPDNWLKTYAVWYPVYGLTNKESDKNSYSFIPKDTNLGEGLETLEHIVEDYFNKNHSNISLWSDVETVIELLITKDDKLKKRYNIKEEDFPKWNDKTLKSFSEGLDIFELLLTKYFEAITKNLDIENNFLEKIYIAHQNSLRMRCSLRCSPAKQLMLPDQFLELLIIPDMVINYNYTDIAERIYKKQNNIRHVHINGEIYHSFGFEPSDEGFTTNIVIGYTNHNNSDVQKDLYHFEKSSRRIVKNTEFFDLETHLIGYDNFDLLIIGVKRSQKLTT